ncbi:MAG TPA: hypothetical protein VFP60_14010 [Pseudolabrys sp.]|nr:hypothetical protein [Pseudolabrys sp.]
MPRNHDHTAAVQAQSDTHAIDHAIDAGLRVSDANINPETGLATDYLNRFNEAVMLLEMLTSAPEFRADFLAWEPKSYREHFRTSRFRTRNLAIAAYESADPNLRSSLDTLAVTMTVVLEATKAAMNADLRAETVTALAGNATRWLKPLIARAGAIISGEADVTHAPSPQALVDQLMKR